jgi:hypothetical protein
LRYKVSSQIVGLEKGASRVNIYDAPGIFWGLLQRALPPGPNYQILPQTQVIHIRSA